MSSFQKLLIWLSPRKTFIATQIKIQKTWMGSTYGGFFVHTPPLRNNATVLSFGVGNDITFDLELMAATGCQVHTFDPTRGVEKFIESYLKEHPQLTFTPIGLSTEKKEAYFYPPENPEHVSCSVIPNMAAKDLAYTVKMKDLTTIIREMGLSKINLLKLDIEGAEYDVIPNILEAPFSIDQILMEIHPDLLASGRKKSQELLEKFQQSGYLIFGVSDTCRELSFIHQSLISPQSSFH